MPTNEKVLLRVFVMPCCQHQLCWVNPRLPNHCPECGASVFLKLKDDHTYTLACTTAWLRYT